MLEDLGIKLKTEIITDATVCKPILLRQGCGKIKHLSTKQLLVQGAIESYGIRVIKVLVNIILLTSLRMDVPPKTFDAI